MLIGITERGDASVHFNQWKKSTSRVNGAIVITKDPRFLYDHLDEFDSSNCIFHCTITGWGGSFLEPNVPDIGNALVGYSHLLAKFGPERVVLRIDPIILTAEGIAKASLIYKYRGGRVRISFLDLYRHVRERLQGTDLLKESDYIYKGNMHADLNSRLSVHRICFPEAEVCGEPGMKCSGCISQRDRIALGLNSDLGGKSTQRKACACLESKTELLSNRHQCRHGCLYCYWK